MSRFEFTDDSVVEIKAKSSLHPIEGETSDVRGIVDVELDDDGNIQLEPQPSGHVEMDVDALKSGHRLQDMEMRRRMEAKKYPTLRYELQEATGGPERFTLRGTLTFHGVSQEFTEEATARVQDGVLHVEGEHTFNIEEFDVKAPKILKLQVYPDVTVVARLVGRQTGGGAVGGGGSGWG